MKKIFSLSIFEPDDIYSQFIFEPDGLSAIL